MHVESAQYISQSVPSNPITTDPLAQGQQHIALIKTVLQTTFPNLNAACTASPADLAAGNATNIQNLQDNTMLAANLSAMGNLSAAPVNAVSGKIQEDGNPLAPQRLHCDVVGHRSPGRLAPLQRPKRNPEAQ